MNHSCALPLQISLLIQPKIALQPIFLWVAYTQVIFRIKFSHSHLSENDFFFEKVTSLNIKDQQFLL